MDLSDYTFWDWSMVIAGGMLMAAVVFFFIFAVALFA